MKSPSLLLLCLMAIHISAAEVQILDGEKAYKTYLSLPGKTCTEWSSGDFVVYTKYQTKNCDENSKATLWNCTIQIDKKNHSQSPYTSASCSREVE